MLSTLLLFITSVFSMTFPRSGTKLGGVIPITIPNILLFLALFFWCLEKIISLHRNPRRPGFKSLLGSLIFFYLCWGGFAVVRGAASTNPVFWAIMAVALLGYTVIYFLIVSRVNTLNALKLYAGIISVSLLIVCLYGIMQQKFGHINTIIPGLTMDYIAAMSPGVLFAKQNIMGGVFIGGKEGVKMFSTFHNGNLFGHHLTTFTPLMIALFFISSLKRVKLYYLAIIILCVVCLVYTTSRGAMAGFLGGIFFLTFFSRDRNLKVFMVFLLILIILLIPFLGYTWRFVAQTKAEPTGGRLETCQREMAGVVSIEDFHLARLNLIGAGIGVSVGGIKAFHNTFLTIFLNLGLVGVFLFFLILVKLFIFGLKGMASPKAVSSPDFLSAFILGGLAGIFGALIHNLVDFLFLLPPIAQNFWMLIGLIVVAIQLKQNNARNGFN